MSLRLTGNWVLVLLDLIVCVPDVFEFWSPREMKRINTGDANLFEGFGSVTLVFRLFIRALG